MVDTFALKHPTIIHPKTYFRGKHCLDYILATPYIAKAIDKVGYAPFYEMGKYDHRLLYIDLNWDYVFQHKLDVTSARGRQLSIKNRRITTKYLNTLQKLENKAGIHRGVKKVRELMANDNQSDKERDYCIKKLKQYKTTMLQLMISANKTATKGKPSVYKWSNQLRFQGKRMRYWNDRKRSSENGDPEGAFCKIPSGYKPPLVYTHDEVLHEYFSAKAEWIKTKDSSAYLHHQYMVDLIEHIGETRGISNETAKKLLYHQEASKAGHEKQSKYIKKQKKGLLTELLIPVPHTTNTNAHIRITDEKTIETILLRRNKTKLTEAVISPFCKGPLAAMINENGRCEVSTQIIDGTFDLAQIDSMSDIKHKMILKQLIQELARKRDSKGELAVDVDTTITTKDYQDMFKNKNELTSCGPRGIIMPHWKIIAENNHLSTIQAWLMEAPFKHGFTYTEWEISVHCMLLKDALPFYHRLRIIQLFEGDMNGALQLLFGKRQMAYMEEHNLNSEETYGGRKGKGCIQALNRIQYTTLYSRTMRQSMGLVDVDASGCFDRMVGRLLSLINQCNGMSQQAASCQAEVLHNMKHFVKTTRGISHNYIQRNDNTLIEGNGQGNAASVPGWHGHNELMCKVYKKYMQGSKIVSPNGRINFEQWLSSFIDDNKMLLSFQPSDTIDSMRKTCQDSLQLWETLLNLTGGAVELTKCFITILHYRESYAWYAKRPGVPSLIYTMDNMRQCIITREGEQGTTIKQQDIGKGVRLLGIKAAANGTFKQEYAMRLAKSKEIAGRLQAAPLNIDLSWQVYYCRWKPAITYCLPITTFNSAECKNIQSPFFMVLLPKLGLNRHMPRALLQGPRNVAGLELVDLEAEQTAQHVTGLISQLRKNDRVGQTMNACIDALQLYLGLEKHFFTHKADKFEHRPCKRESQLVFLWEELNSIKCKLVSSTFWTPTAQGNNDVSIIEAIYKVKEQRRGTVNHLPKTTVWYVNACRLYLKVTMLSEICTDCGQYVEEWAMTGSARNQHTTLVYPHQSKPPPQVWKVWREALRAAFLGRSMTGQATLTRPLIKADAADNRISWRRKITHGMKLEAAIELLPDYIKEALGSVTFPSNNGQHLSDDMLRGHTTSYTDGTVKTNIGAHAYTIRTSTDVEATCLYGTAGTPGDSTTMTSLRAEHYGIFATVILVDLITLVHGHRTISQHIHYTDSQSVIDRLQKFTYMTDRQYDTTDFDIWMETKQAIQRAQHIQFQIKHVKGHQRESLHIDQNKQGPLTRAATYNDWCDRAAETEREKHNLPVQLSSIPAAVVYLQTPSTLVTASAYSVVYDMKTVPAAEIYVKRKLSLTTATFNLVHWKAIGMYMKALAISQRVKVMKYTYDWQNVGAQKEQQNWANTEEYLCPFGCGQTEVSMHYLTCNIACDSTSRMCLEAINRWMLMVRTNHSVRVFLMRFFYTNLPITRQELHIEYLKPPQYATACAEQEQIGWKLTMKGLLSKKWSDIQEEEYGKIREREKLEVWYTGSWWTKNLIKHIIFWALNEWQKRNECLHQDIEQRQAEATRRQNNEEISKLYQLQEDQPIAKLKRYYKTALIEKFQQNLIRQRQWIDTIRALRDKAAIQNSKNRL
jgi:hypothetical protein